MKFSHSVQFNAVPEWSSKYIAYSQLKKLVYNLQKERLLSDGHDDEHTPLAAKDPTQVFTHALDLELHKIDKFFVSQQSIAMHNLSELLDDTVEFEQEWNSLEDSYGVEPYRPRTHSSGDAGKPFSLKNAGINMNDHYQVLADVKITLKKRCIAVFTNLSELKTYIELNQTGFAKILKKFDKSLETNIKDNYIQDLAQRSTAFQPDTVDHLQECINKVVQKYADMMFQGDTKQAKKELSLHLREHVVWERNTVWKDMINMERKSQNAKQAKKDSQDVLPQSTVTDLDSGILKVLFGAKFVRFCAISLLAVALLWWSPFSNLQQRNCFAIIVFASLMWATETIPLFVTSLFVPLLIVVLSVLKNTDGKAMTPTESSQYILSTMWSSVIMLLLGGFTLAAALSKYNIAKIISTQILASAGTNPKFILLTNMGVALFVSMWVSNVAAPVLCYSIIQPLLRTLPKKSTYAKSLILGIALASNIGGMASPIASPQNIISIGLMDPQPSWGQWFVIAIPVCLVSLFLIWLLLVFTFPIDKDLRLLKLHAVKESFTATQYYIIGVTILTIILWCLASSLSGVFGEMGIISIIPMLLLFGTGLLTTDDFNNFMWTIVVLAMGGTTLGKAVSSSGLLATIADSIKNQIEGYPLFAIVLLFGLLILVMATFVSHTVAALIIVPLMAEIGNSLPEPHPRLLIMISAFLCSGAMGLPTSGFPNVTAISMIDDVGDRYLTVGNFITRGVPAGFIAYGVIVTVGYGLMRMIGF